MKLLSLWLTLTFFLLSIPSLFAQAPSNQPQLKLEEIMKGEDFVGHLPSNFRWADDSQTLYFNWNPEQKPLDDLYKITLENPKPILVSKEEESLMSPRFGVRYNADKTAKVYLS